MVTSVRAFSALLARWGHRAEADRARAILLTLEGREAAGIAAALGVHVGAVREWRGLFAEGGTASLQRRKPPGRPSRIGIAATALAEAILDEDDRHDGGWTLPRLRGGDRASWGTSDLGRLALDPAAPKGFTWRRPRHTLKGRQDTEAVAAGHSPLMELRRQAAAAIVDLLPG